MVCIALALVRNNVLGTDEFILRLIVSYKDLIEIGTLAFGTDEQKEAMGFKRGCGWRL